MYNVGDIVARMWVDPHSKDAKVRFAVAFKIIQTISPKAQFYQCEVYKNGECRTFIMDIKNSTYNKETYFSVYLDNYFNDGCHHILVPPHIQYDEIEKYCKSMCTIQGLST